MSDLQVSSAVPWPRMPQVAAKGQVRMIRLEPVVLKVEMAGLLLRQEKIVSVPPQVRRLSVGLSERQGKPARPVQNQGRFRHRR